MLGPFSACDGSEVVATGGPQQRALLAMLVLATGTTVSRDRLVAGLWGERPPKSAVHILESYVSRLRLLGIDLVTESRGYGLRADPDAVDLLRFQALCADARAAMAAGAAPTAAGLWRDALALFRGPALDGLRAFPFADTEVRRIDELRLAAVQDRVDAELAAGGGDALIGELTGLVAEHPFVERLHGQLMLALYREGRQAEALAVFGALRRRLVDELGIEPGAAVRDVHLKLLRQEAPGGPATPPPGAEAPPSGPSRRGGLVAVAVLAVAVAAWAIGFAPDGASAPRTATGNAVVVLARSGDLRGEVDLPEAPDAVASGAGAVWVSQFQGHAVARIDPAARRVEQTIPVGSGPSALAVGAGAVWVANTLDGTVSRIDTTVDRVVDTIAVGGEPAALAYGGRSVWVADSRADELVRVDVASGRVVARTPVPSGVTGVAFAGGAAWVSSDRAGTVARVDPRDDDIAEVRVGTGPTSVAADAAAIWVANTLDGTVSRIDPATRTVTQTLPVGNGATGLAVAGTSVWVANEFDGTVARIDAERGEVAQTFRVRDRPVGAAAGGGQVWLAMRAAPVRHRGGTLRVAVTTPSLDTLDPARQVFLSPGQLLGATNDGLVTFKHVGGSGGTRLVPDLATTLPSPAGDGRTYRFQLRTGIRYSSGEVVRPADFRRALVRVFRLGSSGAPLYRGIVGGRRCLRAPSRCDLRRGIVTNDAANTVTFVLTAADPDFLAKLAAPYAVAVPGSVPLTRSPRLGVPATGPYMVDRYVAGETLVLRRNPHFREWSNAARPPGFVDRIEYSLDRHPDAVVNAIRSADADYGIYDVPYSPPGDRLHELLTRFPARTHVNPLPGVNYFIFNTRVPPFDDVRVRRAVNFAVDRRVLVDLNGGPDAAGLTCQVLPPGLSGHEPYCPYTRSAGTDGGYGGPALARARRLVRASGTRGMRITLLTDPHLADTEYVVGVLRRLGYRATARPLANDRYDAFVSDTRNRVQMSVGGTLTDFPAASDIIRPWLSCEAFTPRSAANANRSGFCDREVDRWTRRALRSETTDPDRARRLWARIDRRVVDRAPWLPTVNLHTIDFLSARAGNYQFHPQWGILLDQLWVR